MAFSLRKKLNEAKDAGTAALAMAVMTADEIAEAVIDKISARVESAQQKAARLRASVGEKVDQTKEAVGEKTGALKEKTIEGLGKLGDSIDEKAAKVSAAASQFGRAARKTLNLKKPSAEAAVEQAAPAVIKAVTPAVKKTPAKPKKRNNHGNGKRRH